MDLWDLPTEIIHYIFIKYLNGRDIYTLRGVSHRWKEIVDGLGESEWQKLCRKDFSKIYKDAYSKSRLSWHSLYKSLSLWQKLPSATVTTHEMPIYAYNISLLENGIIALPQNLNDPAKDLTNYPGFYSETDGIVYYDSETLEECGRVDLGFNFYRYDENEDLLAVIKREKKQTQLIIISKADMKQHHVGNISIWWTYYCEGPMFFTGFKIYKNVVCFKNSENEIRICKFETHGIKTVFKSFDERVVSITFVNVNRVNILTAEGHIYTLVGENLSQVYTLDKCDQNNELILEKYNFNWTLAPVSVWLGRFHRDQFRKDLLSFEFKLSSPDIFRYIQIYENIVIVGRKNQIEFYYDPFGPSGELVNDNKPIFTLNLSSKKDVFNERSKVKVVEVENGHKVIVFLSTKVFIINCVHKSKWLRLRTLKPAFRSFLKLFTADHTLSIKDAGCA